MSTKGKPLATICADKHVRVVHYEAECPLCEALIGVAALEDQLDIANHVIQEFEARNDR